MFDSSFERFLFARLRAGCEFLVMCAPVFPTLPAFAEVSVPVPCILCSFELQLGWCGVWIVRYMPS